jgi:1-deoxy-D-xylulose-5-phosphate reductoisomerase
MRKRAVAILGSTGSIGTQALAVIARHPDSFEVESLAAGGSNIALLAEQVVRFRPRRVAVTTDDAAVRLQSQLAASALPERQRPVVLTGALAAAAVAASGADVVLNAISGAVGLEPTLAALRSGSVLALANKESLVVGGVLVKQQVVRPGQIVPVDSEHSAIAQCLRGGRRREVERLILTASGGPFRGRARQTLAAVTVEEALAHPTWAMGPVVTINSATLMNKALELIEAHYLFELAAERIDVVVHPQSVVHSMVAFRDGAILAQASPPDMRLPIALALSWPKRLPNVIAPVDFALPTSWQFEPLDEFAFPAVALARQALAASATHPVVLNAANEVAVELFLAGGTVFPRIVDTVADVLASYDPPGGPVTLSGIMAADRWARSRAAELLAGEG